MVNCWREIDIAAQPPHLGQGVGIVDIALPDLEHQGNGQRITEVRMVPKCLNEGVILREQVRKDGSEFDSGNTCGKESGDQADENQRNTAVGQG